MGAYTSRPATVVTDSWREQWRKRYFSVLNALKRDSDVVNDLNSLPALLTACLNRDVTKVKELLEDPNVIKKTPVSDLTSVHVSAISGAVDCLQTALCHGDSSQNLTRNHISALHLAVYNGSQSVVKYLCECEEEEKNLSQKKMRNTERFPDIRTDHAIAPLHVATWIGNLEIVKILIDAGAEVDVNDVHSLTPLHIACHRGFAEIAQYLISRGASINSKSVHLDTPLHLACNEDNKECFFVLLCLNGYEFYLDPQFYTDTNTRKPVNNSKNDNSPDSNYLNTDIFSFGLGNSSNNNTNKDNDGDIEIDNDHRNSNNNNNGFNLNSPSTSHRAQAHFFLNSANCVDIINNNNNNNDNNFNDNNDSNKNNNNNNKRYNTNQIINNYNNNHNSGLNNDNNNNKYNIKLQYIRMREKVVNNNNNNNNINNNDNSNNNNNSNSNSNDNKENKVYVDVNVQDKEQHTALHYCCRRGFYHLAVWLLNAKANPHMTNAYGDTCLHSACYGRQLEIVSLLLNRCGTGDMKVFNIFSESPLHAAATAGAPDRLIRLLLSSPSSSVNQQGPDGHTALHSACWNGHIGTASLLLEHGAEISKTTIDNITPIKWAYTKGYDAIVELLQMHSGDREQYPVPSPLGKIRMVTQDKAEIFQLKKIVHKSHHIDLIDVDLLEVVGNGSFGKVYKAMYKGSIVAVKRLRSQMARIRSDVDMFCREVTILSDLEHPNVIKFVGACMTEPTQFCIVTQYYSGGSLHENLHVHKRVFDLPCKLGIVLDVAQGMNYLHNLPQPIIHRDLNSFNILLDENNRGIVADFGESRFLYKSERRDTSELTKQPGNLRWMAPEVFVQSTKYTTKADVFSYSLCVWELFSVQVPFSHLQPAAAGAEMAYHHHRPTIPDSCPAFVSVLLAHAWSAEVEKRPNFTEIAEWLLTQGQGLPPRFKSDTLTLLEQTLQSYAEDCQRNTIINGNQKIEISPNGYVLNANQTLYNNG